MQMVWLSHASFSDIVMKGTVQMYFAPAAEVFAA
jgi:hypothetical protein